MSRKPLLVVRYDDNSFKSHSGYLGISVFLTKYEIKYKKVDEDYYQVGYSSYNLNNVLKWRDECFELVNVKTTNTDRIRNMSDEELASVLFDSCIESMNLEECPYSSEESDNN